MSVPDYDKQISLRDDGVYVDGVKVPGCVEVDFEVGHSLEVPDHWRVRINLITSTQPKFEFDKGEAETVEAWETTTYRQRSTRRTEGEHDA
jgi:hypothetical protein